MDILDQHRVIVDGVTYQVDFMPVGDQPVYTLIVDGKSFDAHVYQNEDIAGVISGTRFSVIVEDEREKRLRAALAGNAAAHADFHLKSPCLAWLFRFQFKKGKWYKKGMY